jgi:hypothetical protein
MQLEPFAVDFEVSLVAPVVGLRLVVAESRHECLFLLHDGDRYSAELALEFNR